MTRIRGSLQNERGVAIVIVMVFAVIMLMLVATILAVGGNESMISGFQRDSTRALEHAQAGVEDAIRRMEGGRKYSNPNQWSSSLPSDTTVELTWLRTGISGGIARIRSASTINSRARRRIEATVLGVVRMFPPNIVYGYNLAQEGTANVTQGDMYAATYVKHKNWPSSTTLSYSGWGMRKLSPGQTAWCYTHAGCIAAYPGNTNIERWYPGQRRTAYEDRPLNQMIGQGTDTRKLKEVLTFTCSAPGPIGTDTIPVNGVGYQVGDKMQNNTPAAGFLYGCDDDLLPYTYVREQFTDGDSITQRVWFKTISFEVWFARYWCFDPAGLVFKKCNELADPLQAWRGAVPPFPPVASLEENYDEYMTGGATIDASTIMNLGCKAPEMSCPGGISTPRIIVLDDGDYIINANLKGHGTWLVDGDLIVNGNLEYWGTLIVNGTVTLGAGTVIIHGGLVSQGTAELSGTITLEAGGSVGNVPVGPLKVTRLSFWER